jgi:hypothetical protein
MKIKKTIFTILISTVFLSLFYFFLSCVYNQIVDSNSSGLFDLSSWSYRYKSDVAIVSLSILFIGVTSAIILNVQRIFENRSVN